MKRTPSVSVSASLKRCGYVTSKGTKCKNPSDSCRFHCEGGSAKSPKSTPRSGKGKSLSPGRSLSPGKPGDIKILIALPIPALHNILLQTPRDELLQLCKAASEMRIRGKHTNIERLCQSRGFQKEYNRIHPYKSYPDIFTGEIEKEEFPLSSMVDIRDESGFEFRILDNSYFDTMNVIFNYQDGYRAIFTKEKDGSWSASAKISDDADIRESDLYPEATIEKRTGRPNLFSRKKEARNNEISLLLKQAIREFEEKYGSEKDTLKKIKKLLKKFGVQM